MKKSENEKIIRLTVRLPESVYKKTLKEAIENQRSLNGQIITKLK